MNDSIDGSVQRSGAAPVAPDESLHDESLHETSHVLIAQGVRDVHSIAKDVDFKLYLDMVVSAAQRTRATTYVLIVALIAIFSSYRVTSTPDWLDARLERLQHAYSCLQGSSTDKSCAAAKQYAAQLLTEQFS